MALSSKIIIIMHLLIVLVKEGILKIIGGRKAFQSVITKKISSIYNKVIFYIIFYLLKINKYRKRRWIWNVGKLNSGGFLPIK